ncbi:MAG: phage major capsid protein [Sulfuriferula sp.]
MKVRPDDNEASNQPKRKPTMKNHQDLIEAITDAAALRAGVITAKAAHPDAHILASSDSKLLQQLALACVPDEVRSALNPAGVFGRGLGSNDFKNSLSSILRSATVGKLNAQARHRAFCDMRGLKSFMPHDFPRVDTDMALVEIAEDAEAPMIAVVDGAGLTERIRTWGRNVNFSRAAILNDDIDFMVSIAANAGASAARLEAGLVYSMLEANPTLGDGESLFHAAHNNLIAAALDETNLFAAMAALRDQPTPAGITADLDAKFVVCASGLEGLARKLLHTAGLNEITVIAAADLPAGRWFVFADPMQSPVIALLHLEGANGGLLVGPAKRKDGATADGVLLGIRHDAGVAAVGRVGCVRGGV